ncbi:hypothetical protein CEE44_01125 [Candidatus Woesearchaeota archaeon B3_Woes]|nr:MAG: hypothetical protein CEE44_01125 [Candidatus Woesearchaeota archaeon B3_Woes]
MVNLLFMAVMYSSEDVFTTAKKDLIAKYSDIKAESSAYSFNFTKYYEKEMGSNLKKKFLIFNKEISKKDLIEIKHFITKIEEKYSDNGRTVNIDPGYLSSNEFVLATFKGKDFKEKISEDVFVHKILEFKEKKIIEFFHTFADYKVKENQEFLLANKPL